MTSYNEPPFETNSQNNYSIFPKKIRKPYKPIKKTIVPWSPKIVKDVPQDLKKNFPNQTFLKPQSQPGIYVLFFPSSKSVYIGESQKVNREILEIKTPGSLARRPLIKPYFDASGIKNVKAYALLQGPSLEDRAIRLREEDRLIKEAGSSAINISGNIHRNAKIRFSSDISVIDPIFIKRTIPWNKDGSVSIPNHSLNYPVLPEKPTEYCLYIFKNKKSGNFYIGQSGKSNPLFRINKHRSDIRKVQYWELRGIKTGESVTYQRMVEDVKNGGNVFEYSIIEYLDQFNETDRKDRESNVIAEAYYQYGNRVYNNLTIRIQKILSKFREFGRTFNATKRNKQLLSYYDRDPERVAQYKNITYPVIVNGKYYDSLSEAGRDLHIQAKTVANRCRSASFPNYIYLKEPKNKIIPNSPEVKTKLQSFNKLLAAYKNRKN